MARYIVTFKDLVAVSRRVGVAVVEAPSSHRGRVGEMGTVLGVTCHWTGTGSSFSPSSDYPDYNVVKEGRPGLDNALSAIGLGRFKAIYVFNEDLSYHAGVWSYGGTTDGNGHFLGIEAAGAGQWTDWQRRVYPRLVASILDFIDEPASSAPTHAMGAMPRGRKSDFPVSDTGWLPDVIDGGATFHDAIAWLLRHPEYINVNYRAEDDDMTPEQAKQLKTIYDQLTTKRATFVEGSDYAGDIDNFVRWTHAGVTDLRDEVKALRDEVARLAAQDGADTPPPTA